MRGYFGFGKVVAAMVMIAVALTSSVLAAPPAVAEPAVLDLAPAVVNMDATPTPSPSPTPTPSSTPSPTPEPTGPVLMVSGDVLDGSTQPLSFTVDLAGAGAVDGDVTWLLDDSYYGKSHAVPHSMAITTSAGSHKLKARWEESGDRVDVTVYFTVSAVTQPSLSTSGASLDGARVSSSLTVDLLNSGGIVGDVAWVVDGVSVGTSTTAPHSMAMSLSGGEHHLEASWDDGGTAVSTEADFYAIDAGVAPSLAVAGAPLDGSHQATTFIVDVLGSEAIVGDVTWLLDDVYLGKSLTAPHWMAMDVEPGDHKLKARWDEDGERVELVVYFTVGADLTYGDGVRLADANVAAPLTAALSYADDVATDVTWILDGEYLGVDEEAPYTADVVAGIGEHTLTAQWPGEGTAVEEATSTFMVQTNLSWKPPATVYEEPAPAMEDLWVTADNRRPAIDGLYDWSKAGFGGGSTLPNINNVRTDATCRINTSDMINTYAVVPDDGVDDTDGIQAAIDHIRDTCSPTGSYTEMSLIMLPQGELNVSHEIHVDADYVLIRGAGSDPDTGTKIVYLPDANTRYDTITNDGTRWDIDAMGNESANGGWLWPGRGLFRVQSREVADRYATEYAAAPENRKDLYEGTVNTHWVNGLTLRSKPDDPGFAARAGDTVIYLSNSASYDNLHVGGLVNVMVANSMNFYDEMEALPTDFELENLYMRRQIFMVVAGDLVNNTITLDKPLEFDVPVDSTSDGSLPINGEVRNSKVAPLVDAIVGVGFEDFYMTQAEPGMDPEMARDNYGNMDPAGAMHGIVFKWAANSWVKGIRTEMTGSHPIVTEDAANLSIVDNYFDGSWNKGKGGNGYLRGSRVWDSLYAGNTLRNLRHFTFQWSASGNVFIGNSTDSDLNLHGGYERNNLFELNEVSVSYDHRPDSCWTNCGDEGGTVTDDADWYPIWWAAGKKAVKWSGSSGPNHVFFNNYFRKQLDNNTTEYQDWNLYSQPGRIYQFGVDTSGDFKHLSIGGTAIPDWAGNENQDYTDGQGVVDTRTSPGRSLFLYRPVAAGYGGPQPQPLRRTWGCGCWDGRGMVNTRLAADPVNTATGALMEAFTDLTLASPGAGMVFSRTYNSQDTVSGAFGPGWTFDQNVSLSAESDGFFYLREPTGAISQFALDAETGTYTAQDPGVTAVLTDRDGGGWIATSRVDGEFEFDSTGRLLRMTDSRGLGVDLTYTAGRLTTITDDLGQTLTLTWTGAGATARVTQIAASDGKTVTYGYATTAGDYRLVTVTGIDGEQSAYGYDAATGYLNSITDPAGGHWAQTTYDATTGRVTSQTGPTGDVTTFQWDPYSETATITLPSGEVRQDIYQGNVLVSQVDNNGRVTTVSYDANNHPTSETNAAQERTDTQYDERGNLISRTIPPAGKRDYELVETWTYDDDNRVLTHTDVMGGTTTYTYDAMGNMLTQTNALGETTTWTYNTLGQILTSTDALGNVTTLAYDAHANLTSVTTAEGRVTTYTYDLSHNRLSRTDPAGNVAGLSAAQREEYTSHWTYDVFGRTLTATDPSDATTTYAYDELGRLTTLTDATGASTTYTYDDAGRPLTITDALGGVTTNTYDDAGNLITKVGPDGATVTFDYDDENRLVSTTDAIGNASGASAATKRMHTTLFTYDTSDRVTSVRLPDPDDPTRYLATTTTYDDLGRPVTVMDPSGAITRTTYNAAGLPLTTTDPTGVTANATYDALGRVITTTQAGLTTTTTYNEVGQVTATSTSDGATTTYEYDDDGQLLRVVSPLGNVDGADPADYDTVFEYDANGNRTAVTDATGNRTETTYDPLGRPTVSTDPLGHDTTYTYTDMGAVATVTTATGAATSYGYDALGAVVSVTKPEGDESSMTYDSAHRISTATSPEGFTTSYTYDLNGNLILTTLPDGSIARTYDSVGRLTAIDYSDATPDMTATYDEAGRPATVTSGTVTAAYEYDKAGRTTSIDRDGHAFTYDYDELGRLTTRTYPDGRSQGYTWGETSRLHATTLSASGTTTDVNYTYDIAGQLTETARENGPVSSYTYDTVGRLTSASTVGGGTVVAQQSIQRNAASQPVTVTTTVDGSTTSVIYSYDAMGQLTQECSPLSGAVCESTSPKVTYTYDANGNRATQTDGTTTTTYTFDSDDRLLSTSDGTDTTTYSYGDNGDLQAKTTGTDTTTYAYGLDGNLYNVLQADGTAVAMAYDESGNRIQQDVDGTTSARWTWDTAGALPVRVSESGDSIYRWFTDPQSGLGAPIASVSSLGTPTWLIADYTGTIIATTSTGGTTQGSVFDAFGVATSGTATQPLGLHGQYFDDELGLYDMRARDYDPTTGQFTAKDSVAVPTGAAYYSSYSYGRNNPLVFSDVTGTEPHIWKDGRITGVPGMSGLWARSKSPGARGAGQGNTIWVYSIANGSTEGLDAVGAGSTGSASGGTGKKQPSALPTMGTCTTAAECEAVVCYDSRGGSGSGSSTGFPIGAGYATGQGFLGAVVEEPVYSAWTQPESGIFNPQPGPADPSAFGAGKPWNESLLRNSWLRKTATAAPYLDYVAAGLEWENNYDVRYADVEDGNERARLATERTIVTTSTGIGTAAIVTAVAGVLLCGESAGAGCALAVAAIAGGTSFAAEGAAGSIYDDSLEGSAWRNVAHTCYGFPVGCLPSYEDQVAY